MIYNQEPIQVMWNWLKDLDDNFLKIYKETMADDTDSVPESYVILKSEINNSPKGYGDGSMILQKADCDIVLTSKGSATNSKCLHNFNKNRIKDKLKSLNISFDSSNLGYDKDLKCTQHVFSVGVTYVA